MVAEIEADSPSKSSVHTGADDRPTAEPQPNVSPAKRRRLENLVQDLAASSATANNDFVKKSAQDSKPDDVLDFNHDIFNTDGDRKELMDVCEKMLDQCKNPSQEDKPRTPEVASTEVSDEKTSPMDPSATAIANDWDNFDDDFDSDTYRDDFLGLHDDSALGDQQLKSAYYFDGERFVAIQVIVDGTSGEYQLILPMDHPHYLGVPEDVPIFETKTVAVKDLTPK